MAQRKKKLMVGFLDFTDTWGEGRDHQEETVYEMHDIWHSEGRKTTTKEIIGH